jgi:hypothetical protein
LGLEKRYSPADPRPDVFCGIAGTIGETLNWERVPTPSENDLGEIAASFVRHTEGDANATAGSRITRCIPATEFSENDRWDVARFWTEDELVALGRKESAVARVDFIDEVRTELDEISSELVAAKGELASLTAAATTTEVSLDDPRYLRVRSGTRITGKEIREHPGKLPIYSCFKTDREVKGRVDEKFFKSKGGVVEKEKIVTVNANGASVGKVYARKDRCGVTDDVIVVEVRHSDIDIDYLAVALRDAVEKGGFLYEAKLFTARVRGLSVEIPTTSTGAFDVAAQQHHASAVKRFDALITRLRDLGVRSSEARTV